jgi:hypothetical protein
LRPAFSLSLSLNYLGTDLALARPYFFASLPSYLPLHFVALLHRLREPVRDLPGPRRVLPSQAPKLTSATIGSLTGKDFLPVCYLWYAVLHLPGYLPVAPKFFGVLLVAVNFPTFRNATCWIFIALPSTQRAGLLLVVCHNVSRQGIGVIEGPRSEMSAVHLLCGHYRFADKEPSPLPSQIQSILSGLVPLWISAPRVTRESHSDKFARTVAIVEVTSAAVCEPTKVPK